MKGILQARATSPEKWESVKGEGEGDETVAGRAGRRRRGTRVLPEESMATTTSWTRMSAPTSGARRIPCVIQPLRPARARAKVLEMTPGVGRKAEIASSIRPWSTRGALLVDISHHRSQGMYSRAGLGRPLVQNPFVPHRVPPNYTYCTCPELLVLARAVRRTMSNILRFSWHLRSLSRVGLSLAFLGMAGLITAAVSKRRRVA